MEETANSAVKELAIEKKLKEFELEWLGPDANPSPNPNPRPNPNPKKLREFELEWS